VIAIFKKGDKSLPSNYRPISLISCVGKIMERVIYKYVSAETLQSEEDELLLILSVVDLAGNKKTNLINYYPHRMINYRPISLISCVGKIMERVIYKYVFSHLQRNKLIYEYQSGFLPKYSTVHQLLEMYNCILNSLQKKAIFSGQIFNIL
jgi:hypothetical protein